MDVTDVRKGMRSERWFARRSQRFKSQVVDPVFAPCTVSFRRLPIGGSAYARQPPKAPLHVRPVLDYRSRVRLSVDGYKQSGHARGAAPAR